jgi:tetratricopeptide (TPR) repeat protein
MVTMKYHASLDAGGKPLLTYSRERLTKREKDYRWQDPVHEFIPLAGNIFHSDIYIWHHKPVSAERSTRNLKIYEAIENNARDFTPRQIYYFARELRDHGMFAKAAYYFQHFLDGKQGWGEDKLAACFCLALCFHALGEEDKVLSALLRSFEYSSPRAEICCEIGRYYQRQGLYQKAWDWFQLALVIPRPDSLGFILEQYWGYIPSIESCVCCCYLLRYDLAEKYNEMAAAIRPDDKAVQHNRKYLAALRQGRQN